LLINLAQFLRLERPLAELDLETTGFDPDKDRIIQIAVTIHYPHRDPIAWKSLINPGIPITNTKEGKHGMTDADVADAPTFEAIGPALAPKLLNVDIAGYNVEFDIGFMRGQMKRCNVNWPWSGHVICSYQIYRKKMPHNLENAYREFGGDGGEPLPRGTKLEGAHDAGIDVAATEAVLRGQLLRYPDLPRTVKELEMFCFPNKANAIIPSGQFVWVDGVACITFGKYVKQNGGKPFPMNKVERNYWKFILDNDFAPDVKEIAASAMIGVYPSKPATV